MGGNPSSARIIQDVYLSLKASDIVYRKKCTSVEGLADRNGNRRKSVGEGKHVSWGGAPIKGKGPNYELTKNMFFHSDFLQLRQKKKRKTNEVFSDIIFFMIKKIALRTNEINRYSAIEQSYCILHKFDVHRTLPKYLRIFLHENAVLMIGLTYQSYYSICHFMVRRFTLTVQKKTAMNSIRELLDFENTYLREFLLV